MYASTANVNKKADVPSDELLLLHRKDQQLQEILQELLDAQADGLLAGLGADSKDDGTPNGSPTPTTHSVRSLSLSPSPRTWRRKLGLGAARREIWKTILECAAVKALIKEELQNSDTILDQLDRWSRKRAGLRKEIAAIEEEDIGVKTQTLKEEATHLQAEITDMEQRLLQMRTRHGQLLDEIADSENSVQSKLSTYRTSLAFLEKDVQAFLKNPPIQSGIQSRRDDTFLSLPPTRRTLEMAKDYWEAEYTALKRRRKVARRGCTALEEGAVVWKEVIAEIISFEKFLKQEANVLVPSANGKGKGRVATEPADLLSRMDSAISLIEEKYKLATSKKWRLLEVAIGTELEAINQAREMLEDTFSSAHDAHLDEELEGWAAPSRHASHDSASHQDEHQEPVEGVLDAHSAGLHQAMYETDEDEPSADLMISHQDDDTD